MISSPFSPPAATPAAAGLLARPLIARSGASTYPHRARVPRGPSSISVPPLRRRWCQWRGPLRSLPPEGKMRGVAAEAAPLQLVWQCSVSVHFILCDIYSEEVHLRSSGRADGRGFQVCAVESGGSHVRPTGELRLAVVLHRCMPVMRVHGNAQNYTVCHTPICEFQALLLIGFEKGETVTVISDVNLQSISIFLHFCTIITFERTKAFQ